MDDCGHGRSALATLTASGCLGPECIAVHLNDWEDDDFALVAPGGPLAGMPVVHCPLSHRYFGHHSFPLERLRALGVNLCVGTDSPASNGSFSLLEELRAAAGVFPSLGAREWLEMITVNPARALGLAERLGRVKIGAWADLVAVPTGSVRFGNPREVYAGVLDCRSPASWLMIHGRAV